MTGRLILLSHKLTQFFFFKAIINFSANDASLQQAHFELFINLEMLFYDRTSHTGGLRRASVRKQGTRKQFNMSTPDE